MCVCVHVLCVRVRAVGVRRGQDRDAGLEPERDQGPGWRYVAAGGGVRAGGSTLGSVPRRAAGHTVGLQQVARTAGVPVVQAWGRSLGSVPPHNQRRVTRSTPAALWFGPVADPTGSDPRVAGGSGISYGLYWRTCGVVLGRTPGLHPRVLPPCGLRHQAGPTIIPLRRALHKLSRVGGCYL